MGEAETDRFLNRFVERKLALELDGRIVGLATRNSASKAKVIDKPAFANWEFPENWLDMLTEKHAAPEQEASHHASLRGV
jgi:hypothetical protein